MAIPININTTIQRNDSHVLKSEVGHELILMDIESGQYIGLNTIAHTIWLHIDKPVMVNDLVKQLMNKYDVEESICTADTIICLEELNEKGLLEIL